MSSESFTLLFRISSFSPILFLPGGRGSYPHYPCPRIRLGSPGKIRILIDLEIQGCINGRGRESPPPTKKCEKERGICPVRIHIKKTGKFRILFNQKSWITVCPGSSDTFYIASLLYKRGHYFLDI